MNLVLKAKKVIKFIADNLKFQQAEILANLINKNNYKVFAEIGVYKGDTSKYLLKHCKLDKVICVEPTIKKEAEVLLHNPKVEFYANKSEDAVNYISDNSIDIIFIDADHRYKEVKKDIELWYPKIKKGGILSGHNYHLQWLDVIKAVSEKFQPVNLIGSTWWIKINHLINNTL